MALLVVDIGNSAIKGARVQGDQVLQRFACGAVPEREPVELLRSVVGGVEVEGCCLCSVVPDATAGWVEAMRLVTGCDPLEVRYPVDLGVPNSHPQAEAVGTDRYANVAGAVALVGVPVIVIDIGTAMTMDVVSVDRGYIGGSIAPGPGLFERYLAEHTARLPEIECVPVAHYIGGSTRAAMQAAGWHGYRGMVRELLQGTMAELGGERPVVLGTGGFGEALLPSVDPEIRLCPDLTLFGLARLGRRA